jgi:putative aldouronate transport system substrate-binding protein
MKKRGKKMKKIAKLASLTLSAAMILSMSGCSKGAAPQDNKAEETGGKVELKFLAPSKVCITDYATNTFTKWMEEKTGVHATWQTIPEQGREEKLSIILASGDLPDVFLGCGINDAMLSKYGVEEQLFMQLDDLIDKHAVNLKQSIQQFQGGLNLVKSVDGHIYSLPTLDVCQHCEHSSKMWIYEPWLKKLGMENPKTTDEFYNMLKAFKEKDPNGNGKADEIPFMGAIKGWHNDVDEFLMNAFVYYDRGQIGYYVKDGVINNSINTEEYRQGLSYLNKLYKEGLMYEGSLTQETQAQVKLVENPDAALVGASGGGFVGMFANLGSDRAKGFRPISPLKGPNGLQQSPTYPSIPYKGDFVLSSECKDPEAAIKYGDLLYTQEATLDIRAGGMKDSFWREAKEGELGFDGKPAVWFPIKPWQDKDPQNESWIQVGVWNFTDLRTGQAVDNSIDLWSLAGNEYMLFKVTQEQYKPYEVNYALPPMNFTVEEQEEVASIKTELQKYFDTTKFNFITGNTSLEKDWDKYLSDLEKTGLTRLKELYQKAYDRQYKK